MSEIMKDMTKIPLEVATHPFEGAIVYMNRYWVVLDDSILIYKDFSPQCNRNKRLVEKSLQPLYPGAEVRFLEVVYLDLLDKNIEAANRRSRC